VGFLFTRLDSSTRVYLIGSRARHDTTRNSDWDFALDAGEPIPWYCFASIRGQCRDIAWPDDIDIVDLQRAPDAFKRGIEDDMVEITT
jgi:predicted nucleotidyltransferase